MKTDQNKGNIIAQYAREAKDTGSTEVQIGLLSNRISTITQHLNNFPKDKASKHGLLKLVGKQRRFLAYLKKSNHDSYVRVVTMINEKKLNKKMHKQEHNAKKL